MRGRGLLLIALALLSGGWDILRSPDEDVEAGNRAFAAGKYAEALERYRSAEERGADPRLSFDAGAALYKLGEQATDPAKKAELFQQSEQAFSRAAEAEDPVLKSSAYFNLGNSLYQRQRWEEAISAYKRALRANGKNEAARHNLEMALRQRPKSDQQQQQSQDGKQGKQGQQGQQQGQQGQQQGQQGQQQGQQPDQQQGQQPGQQGQPQDQPGQKDQQQGQQPGQEGQQPGQKDQQQGQQPGQKDQQQGQQGRDGQQQGKEDQQRGQSPGQADKDGAGPPGRGGREDGSAPPSDQDRKLDELERRSRDLRKRLLRQSARNRDPLRLPSRKDW